MKGAGTGELTVHGDARGSTFTEAHIRTKRRAAFPSIRRGGPHSPTLFGPLLAPRRDGGDDGDGKANGKSGKRHKRSDGREKRKTGRSPFFSRDSGADLPVDTGLRPSKGKSESERDRELKREKATLGAPGTFFISPENSGDGKDHGSSLLSPFSPFLYTPRGPFFPALFPVFPSSARLW